MRASSSARRNLDRYLEAFRQTLRNLGAEGVDTVCYNFMPVLDWARTQLRHGLPGGATALRFNAHEFAAFDVYMLARPGAEQDWSAGRARARAGLVRCGGHGEEAGLARHDHGRAARRVRSLRHRGAARHARPLSRRGPRGAARESAPVPRGGRAGGGSGRGAAVHPSGRSAAPAARPAAHRVERRRHRLPARCGRLAGEWSHPLHRLPRRPACERPARDRAPLRQPHPFRASAQRQQTNRTARSWRRTTSPATPTWSPSSKRC